MSYSAPDRSGSTPPIAKSWWVSLSLLAVFHVIAVCRLLNPLLIFDDSAVLSADFPMHEHHTNLFRQSVISGNWGWGCDPQINAGAVLRPTQDAGGRLHEVMGLLLYGVSPAAVLKLDLLLAALAAPGAVYLAALLLRVPLETRLWTLVVFLSSFWLYPMFYGFLRWGMIDFTLASAITPVSLALFVRFLEQPCWRWYGWFLLSACLLFFVHVTGVVVAALPLIALTLGKRSIPARHRAALVAAPLVIAAVNSYWLIPFLLAARTPVYPAVNVAFFPSDLTYHSWSELLYALTPAKIAVLVMATGGVVAGSLALSRQAGPMAALAFALAIAAGLLLKLFGSFLPGVASLQPSRFILPAVFCSALPISSAIVVIFKRFKLSTSLWASAWTLATVLVAAFCPRGTNAGAFEKDYAGNDRAVSGNFLLALPESAPVLSRMPELFDFVAVNCTRGDRLLMQTYAQCEPLEFARITGCEVIGNAYPDSADPAQFLAKSLFGRQIKDWTVEELRVTCQRWGVSWAFASSEPARLLFAQLTGAPGKKAGPYQAFHVQSPQSRFFRGTGIVEAGINRITLSDLAEDEETLVLRYRYHPCWRADDENVRLEKLDIPDDANGFLLIRKPARLTHLALHFQPWRLFDRSLILSASDKKP